MMLTGLHVIVTRPEHQSHCLRQLLSQVGAVPYSFPTIAITKVADPISLHAAIASLAHADLLIFTSANAVMHGATLIPPEKLSHKTRLIGIGPATTRRLLEHGFSSVIMPTPPYNSEAVLQLPELQQLTGKKITLFCGVNPRPFLGDALRQRGGVLTQADCYERICPETDISPLLHRFKQGKVDVIVSTSNESLLNLLALLGKGHQHWLFNTPIVVVNPLMVTTLQTHGYPLQPIVAPNAVDDTIIATLLQWYKERDYER